MFVKFIYSFFIMLNIMRNHRYINCVLATTEAEEYEKFISNQKIIDVKLHEFVAEIRRKLSDQVLSDPELKKRFNATRIKFHLIRDVNTIAKKFALNEMKGVYQNEKNLLPKISNAIYLILKRYKNDERLHVNMYKYILLLNIIKESRKITKCTKKYSVSKRKYMSHGYRCDNILEDLYKISKEVFYKVESISRSFDFISAYQKYKHNCYRYDSDKEKDISDIKSITHYLIVILDSTSLLLEDIIKSNKIPSTNVFSLLNEICKDTSLDIKKR